MEDRVARVSDLAEIGARKLLRLRQAGGSQAARSKCQKSEAVAGDRQRAQSTLRLMLHPRDNEQICTDVRDQAFASTVRRLTACT